MNPNPRGMHKMMETARESMPSGWMLLADWAKREGIPRARAYQMVQNAKLRVRRLNRHWLIVPEEAKL